MSGADPTTPDSGAHSATIEGVPGRLFVIAVLVGAIVLAAGCGSESGDTTKAPLSFCRAAARFDDRLLIPGAQPEEVFDRVLERVGHSPRG